MKAAVYEHFQGPVEMRSVDDRLPENAGVAQLRRSGIHFSILTLAFAVAIFQVSNSLLHESGITAAIVAGFMVGNVRSHALDEIVDSHDAVVVRLHFQALLAIDADVVVHLEFVMAEITAHRLDIRELGRVASFDLRFERSLVQR